jgi:hypothetical protein
MTTQTKTTVPTVSVPEATARRAAVDAIWRVGHYGIDGRQVNLVQ